MRPGPTEWYELNAYIYYSVQNAVLDGVIWCLGPYVDRTGEYGIARLCLARATRAVLRPFCTRR